MVPTYTLSPGPTKGTSLVASRIASGSTPVASGSSVPRCPTRRVPSQRRAASTTSCDVQPTGLSTTRKPIAPGRSMLRAIADLPEQRQRVRALGQRRIVQEVQLGRAAQRELPREAAAQEAG